MLLPTQRNLVRPALFVQKLDKRLLRSRTLVLDRLGKLALIRLVLIGGEELDVGEGAEVVSLVDLFVGCVGGVDERYYAL